MSELKQHIIRVGLVLGLFAVIATTLVALTENTTHEQIKSNEREALLSAISEVVPAHRFDNAILEDTMTIPATSALGTKEATQIYRARLEGLPVAAVLTVIAPNGYSGSITMLVGIYYDGSLAGVRVVNHKETPGLGDKIDVKRNNWITQFSGLNLDNPSRAMWKVKKDGGAFDQFTGATITPRAVIGAVKRALVFFETERDNLFVVTEPTS
jgi:electron transport complex protein RnfG